MTVNFLHIWMLLLVHKFFDPKFISKRCSESLILLEIIFWLSMELLPIYTHFLLLNFILTLLFYELTSVHSCVAVVLPIIFNLFSNKES